MEIKDFIGGDLDDQAVRAQQYYDMFVNNELSESEFKDLIEDIKRENFLNDYCGDMQLKSDFLKVLDLASNLI